MKLLAHHTSGHAIVLEAQYTTNKRAVNRRTKHQNGKEFVFSALLCYSPSYHRDPLPRSHAITYSVVDLDSPTSSPK
jgi:hypothetical protein